MVPDVLDRVSRIDGAIGYAETLTTTEGQATTYPNLKQIQLNGRDASVEQVKNGGYQFWAIEYFYSYGDPGGASRLSAFLEYLSSDRANAIIQQNGYIPCIDINQAPLDLCAG